MDMLAPIARRRAEAFGEVGRQWLASLPSLVAELEGRWQIATAEPMTGGTGSLVLSAVSSTGAPVVLKLLLPDPESDEEIATLARAKGRGFVRLLEHDITRRAMLLEALGPSLATSGFPPERQLSVLGSLAAMAWRLPRPDGDSAATPVNKAAALGQALQRMWHELDPECSLAVRDAAAACAERLSLAFDPANCVVLHGDAAAANALQALEPRAGLGPFGYVWVDPDSFVGDPTYDLGVALRDWCTQLLAASDPQALMDKYAGVIASHADVDPASVRDWAFLERVTTGLTVLKFGSGQLSAPFFQSAAALLD